MNIYVLDKQLNIVDVIDSYNSIIWTNRYYECGDFELYLSATPSLIYTLREDYYLVREGKEENAMIIETIQIKTDEEEGNYITVSGRCLKSIFYRRIIWQQTQVSGFIENCISTLINQNVISPSDANRKIENVSLGYLIQTNTSISAQYTGNNLGEAITAICQSYGLGWGISLDLENKKFIFNLYSGVDRSYNQEKTPWVIFSNEYDNLLSTEYGFSKTDYANVAKIAGEGEGLARKNITVGDAQGLERYELYVDARDVSSNEGEISDDEYYLQLAEKGNEKLAETVKTESFSGEVIEYQYAYGQDYSLGDIVEVVNEYGMMAVSRITEVIESEDESGIYTIPTFSAWEGFAIAEPEEIRNTMLFVPQPTVIEQPTISVMNTSFTGKEFNSAIKTVARNTETVYSFSDYTIKTLSFSDEPPSDGDISKVLEESEEGYKFIVYRKSDDGGNVKMYCDADIIKLNGDMSEMFYYNRGLTSLDLSRFDTSNVNDMNYMFFYCQGLTELDLSNFDTSNVTDMSCMFYYCNNLTELDLSNFNTNNVTKMYMMFYNCTSLKELDLSNFNITKVQMTHSMFYNCKNLISLDLSSFRENDIGNDPNSNGFMTFFYGCNSLQYLNLSNLDTSKITNMGSMFYNCTSLKELDLSNFDTRNVTNMGSMFRNCYALTKILVSSSTWVNASSNNYMFYNCGTSELTYV